MAKNHPLPEDAEMMIPVFTVLKNGAILKNIFIVDKSPELESLASSVHDYDHGDDILIVGRHPDCNIMLTHPSISRFHLEIQSNPSSQKLSVVDLSSVHGTWVSERKIEPGVSVELKEGDTLRIGASSRVYRLHWIPISRAYDLEISFVSGLDLAVEAEKGQEGEALPEEEEKEIVQKENFCLVDNKDVQSVDSILESVNCLFPDENLEVFAKKEIPSAPLVPADFMAFYCGEEENCPAKDNHQEEKTTRFLSGPSVTETLYMPTNSQSENKVCDTELQVLSPPHVESVFECDKLNTAFQGPEKMPNSSVNMESLFHVEEEFEAYLGAEMPRETNILSTLGEYLRESICLPVVEAVQGTKMQQVQGNQKNAPSDAFTSQLPPVEQKAPFEKHWSNKLTNLGPVSFDTMCAAVAAEMPKETGFGCTLREDDRGRHILTTGAENLITEKTLLPVEEANLGTEFQQVKIVEEVALDSLSDGEKQINCCPEQKLKFQPYQNSSPCLDQGHSMDGIVQDIGVNCTESISLISLPAESLKTPLPKEPILEISNKNQTRGSFVTVAGCSKKKIPEIRVESIQKKSTCSNIWSRRGKAAIAPQIRTSKSRVKSTANVDTEVDTSNQKDIKENTKAKDLLSVLDGGEEDEEIFTPDKENFSPNTLQLRFLKKKGKLEEIKHYKSQRRSRNSKDYFSFSLCPDEIPISEKENHTMKVAQEQKSERRPFGSHIKLEQDIIDMGNQKDITNGTISKNLLSDLDEEEEYHTLDKENFSPNTLQLLLLEKKGKVDGLKHSKSRGSHSSNANSSSNIYPDENQTSKVAKEQKSKRRPFGSHIKLEQEKDVMAMENRLERLPFQSLLMDSDGKSRRETSRSVSAASNISSNTCVQILDKCTDSSHISERSWNMVVDAASLLNKESRKALLLLQGLKGTRLIIPRMVIKELDSMKRQFSFFRRTSEASSALEWIEECMVKTKWWIDVQSSMEEGRLIAPTPPATPQTQFSEEGWTFSLSSRKSSMEIVSPTVEDHILDCALLYRRKQNEGQLVLLSDDVTLKIKSMAEGLLCETAQEFRESLVNPFSERFLWANSSPRGQTWSCQDDVVLREKYCRSPLRKSSKGEGARGLKLILLHNSRYGQFSSAR